MFQQSVHEKNMIADTYPERQCDAAIYNYACDVIQWSCMHGPRTMNLSRRRHQADACLGTSRITSWCVAPNNKSFSIAPNLREYTSTSGSVLWQLLTLIPGILTFGSPSVLIGRHTLQMSPELYIFCIGLHHFGVNSKYSHSHERKHWRPSFKFYCSI